MGLVFKWTNDSMLQHGNCSEFREQVFSFFDDQSSYLRYDKKHIEELGIKNVPADQQPGFALQYTTQEVQVTEAEVTAALTKYYTDLSAEESLSDSITKHVNAKLNAMKGTVDGTLQEGDVIHYGYFCRDGNFYHIDKVFDRWLSEAEFEKLVQANLDSGNVEFYESMWEASLSPEEIDSNCSSCPIKIYQKSCRFNTTAGHWSELFQLLEQSDHEFSLLTDQRVFEDRSSFKKEELETLQQEILTARIVLEDLWLPGAVFLDQSDKELGTMVFPQGKLWQPSSYGYQVGLTKADGLIEISFNPIEIFYYLKDEAQLDLPEMRPFLPLVDYLNQELPDLDRGEYGQVIYEDERPSVSFMSLQFPRHVTEGTTAYGITKQGTRIPLPRIATATDNSGTKFVQATLLDAVPYKNKVARISHFNEAASEVYESPLNALERFTKLAKEYSIEFNWG